MPIFLLHSDFELGCIQKKKKKMVNYFALSEKNVVLFLVLLMNTIKPPVFFALPQSPLQHH